MRSLSSMTGDQLQAPSSPREGDDPTSTIERPKPTDIRLKDNGGCFNYVLFKNIMGIIYYIRFSW
ncbi:hypothetical protein Leryth_026765 [Lithospermum erythrorhizon]|nr:hypothetical protein Leryth_026765 [Lithospermum erythrorhizon]